MMRSVRLGLVLLAALVVGCQPGADREQLEAVQRQQEKILAKLDDLGKKLDGMERPAPRPRRRRGPDPARQYEIPVADSAVRGAADADVTIVEFSDYQCPFCARTEPLIADVLEAYPEQARFVYKHFPLTSIHPNAMPAARAAVAAGKQGKFWELHDKLFENFRSLTDEKITELAREVGLDMEQFEQDRKSDETEKAVRQDMQLASRVGVRGTPTIFVNGRLLQNRSLDGFKQMIDAELKKSG